MRIRSTRLGFAPSAAALRLIDTCAQELVPEEEALAEWHTAYAANHRLRIAHDLDIITRQFPVTDTILEFGSIPLLLTGALARYGYRVTGCDIAPERYSSTIRSSGLNVVKCNIETERLPFADASFDAAIFNELFEHLRINPIHTLRELLRVIKPNGTVTLSTPNLKSLGGMRNFLFADKAYSCSPDIYAEYKKLEDVGHMGHVREYTPTEVVEFLQRIGFEVTTIVFRGEYESLLPRTLIKLVPRLSPFVSYMARKPAKATLPAAATSVL
jgi:SAM-dependent methyltransferase